MCATADTLLRFHITTLLTAYTLVRASKKDETQATHERDRTAEDRIARQRRINEAGDPVPGSQDPLTRRAQTLQLSDTLATQTALPASAPLADAQLSETCSDVGATAATGMLSLCSMCSRSRSLRGATDHSFMLHMVQKHGGQQLIHESVVQQRNSTLRPAFRHSPVAAVPSLQSLQKG